MRSIVDASSRPRYRATVGILRGSRDGPGVSATSGPERERTTPFRQVGTASREPASCLTRFPGSWSAP
jgi:hypothetical protein